MKKYEHMETAVIHSGYDAKVHLGSLSAPIFQTSTFVFDTAEEGERRFAGEEEGFIYSRLGNPTIQALEERIAVMEGAEAGLSFASGMAAVSAVLVSFIKTGSRVICSQGLYGCTFGLLQMLQEKFQVGHDFCEMKTAEQLEALMGPETACIYIETPINPTMQVLDLKMVADTAHKYGIPVIVDNTFCSPYLQKPLDHGCDVVIHSATKYICGHGDVIAGLAAGSKEMMQKIAASERKDIGGTLSPFDAWLLLRGIKTLPVRMDRHCSNAEKLYGLLKKEPGIKQVFYPGDPDGPDADIANKQMKHGGGLISFEVNGTKEDAQRFLNELKLIKIAVSLGDAETLIQHPATMTHAVVPETARLQMGITDQLIRLSVGLENWEDLWNDLSTALAVLPSHATAEPEIVSGGTEV